MPYCINCGAQIPAGALYCPNCGRAVVESATSSQSSQSAAPTASPVFDLSHSELENLAKDRYAQEHWISRLIAFVIDWIIVIAAVFILELIVAVAILGPRLATAAVGLPAVFFGISLASGLGTLALLFYFTLAEWLYGRSFGKDLFHLRVVVVDGSKLVFGKALILNISKIFWVLLLLDVFCGLIVKSRRGQKYSDYVANTNVIKLQLSPSEVVSSQGNKS